MPFDRRGLGLAVHAQHPRPPSKPDLGLVQHGLLRLRAGDAHARWRPGRSARRRPPTAKDVPFHRAHSARSARGSGPRTSHSAGVGVDPVAVVAERRRSAAPVPRLEVALVDGSDGEHALERRRVDRRTCAVHVAGGRDDRDVGTVGECDDRLHGRFQRCCFGGCSSSQTASPNDRLTTWTSRVDGQRGERGGHGPVVLASVTSSTVAGTRALASTPHIRTRAVGRLAEHESGHEGAVSVRGQRARRGGTPTRRRPPSAQ